MEAVETIRVAAWVSLVGGLTGPNPKQSSPGLRHCAKRWIPRLGLDRRPASSVDRPDSAAAAYWAVCSLAWRSSERVFEPAHNVHPEMMVVAESGRSERLGK
jgi:hypothetical protein